MTERNTGSVPPSSDNMAMGLLLRGNTALNIEEIVLTNLEAVTNSRLSLVDPHEARQLEDDVKIPG